jgi:hypothetical protein
VDAASDGVDAASDGVDAASDGVEDGVGHGGATPAIATSPRPGASGAQRPRPDKAGN